MPAKKARKPVVVVTTTKITTVIAVLACSPAEEDFFRTGEKITHDDPSPSFEDLDVGYQPTTMWQAIMMWVRGAPQHEAKH